MELKNESHLENKTQFKDYVKESWSKGQTICIQRPIKTQKNNFWLNHKPVQSWEAIQRQKCDYCFQDNIKLQPL